ncbi:putative oxoglutarate/iron-dependent dioxygenase, non-hem dioxygenase domain-containing protein [Septoria linicola]|nr:putative oxoglutarate/iron-dependent dioxygenase, non-hem dioxygenase domain-containing protein [Septoria linicola]
MDDVLQIPVIDISEANPKAPQQLLDAARSYGFVFVANNLAGISPGLVDEVFQLSRDFFALPTEEKEAVSISSNKAGKNHGWLSQGVEKLDPATQKRPDVKEAFNLGLPTPHNSTTYSQPIPSLLQAHISTLSTFQSACHTLCQRLLTHFATALSIPPDWFTSRHDISLGGGDATGSIFRLLYYPQQTSHNDEVDVRAGAHSDYGSITCLFQLPGQPGLEIKTPRGEWAAVPVDPSSGSGASGSEGGKASLPILVNIGDLLEDWTGGLLKSTVHRVVFPNEKAGDRYSIAYFCHPLDEALLEPVPSALVEEHARRDGRRNGKEGFTARDHLMERLAATYSVK